MGLKAVSLMSLDLTHQSARWPVNRILPWVPAPLIFIYQEEMGLIKTPALSPTLCGCEGETRCTVCELLPGGRGYLPE